MKNLMFAFAAAVCLAVVSGCCCPAKCSTAKAPEFVPFPEKDAYVSAAGAAVAAAAQSEKEYEWQIFPAYMAAADDNEAVKMVGIIDGQGYLIWDYAGSEEDFAMIPAYSSEIRKVFADLKASVDGSGSAASNGVSCGKGTARAYVFTKIGQDSRIPAEGADSQYFVMLVEYASGK